MIITSFILKSLETENYDVEKGPWIIQNRALFCLLLYCTPISCLRSNYLPICYTLACCVKQNKCYYDEQLYVTIPTHTGLVTLNGINVGQRVIARCLCMR